MSRGLGDVYKRQGSESAESLGVTVALMIADKLLARLPDCKADIYAWLADLSGKTPAEIAALDMGVFAEAVFTLMEARISAIFLRG